MNVIEHVLAVQCRLGEGPLWHVGEQALYFVDIEGDCFYRYMPANGMVMRIRTDMPIGAIAFRQSGGLLLATKNGFASWDRNNPQLQFITDPESHRPHARFNDGAVDRQGRFWAGTISDEPASALYRFDPDHRVHTMATGITVSNGIGWSPDNRLMYYIDSATQKVDVFDFEPANGTIHNRRTLIDATGGTAFPDGMAVDSVGDLWVAWWGGGKITHHDSAGNLLETHRLPVQYPTSCAFGGADLKDLYITSAWVAIPDEERGEQPLAGDIFRLRVENAGIPEPHFAG
jgi:sugar lactone lactonase YvrE